MRPNIPPTPPPPSHRSPLPLLPPSPNPPPPKKNTSKKEISGRTFHSYTECLRLSACRSIQTSNGWPFSLPCFTRALPRHCDRPKGPHHGSSALLSRSRPSTFDHYVTPPPLSRAQVPGPDSDGPDFQLLAPHVTSPPYSRLAQRLTPTRVARIPDSARFDHTVKLLPLGGPSA